MTQYLADVQVESVIETSKLLLSLNLLQSLAKDSNSEKNFNRKRSSKISFINMSSKENSMIQRILCTLKRKKCFHFTFTQFRHVSAFSVSRSLAQARLSDLGVSAPIHQLPCPPQPHL
jgi:hypothetical protein